MDDELIYIPSYIKQNYPYCRLLIEKWRLCISVQSRFNKKYPKFICTQNPKNNKTYLNLSAVKHKFSFVAIPTDIHCMPLAVVHFEICLQPRIDR